MKFRSLAKFLLLVTLTSISAETKADILFIDLNNAPQEIEAARRALKPGEKLYVIPTKEMKESKAQLEPLYRERERLQNEFSNPATTPERRAAIRREYIELNRRISELSSFRVTARNLKAELQKAIESGIRPTRFVISGHDGNGHFNGDYGDLNRLDLAEAFAEVPGACDSLTTMFLWGCWTVTPGALIRHWKKICPSIRVFGGFEDSAPSKFTRASHTILEGMLKKDSEIQQAATKEQLANIFKRLPGVRGTRAALCANDTFISTASSPRSLTELQQACEQVAGGPLYQRYLCYYNGEPGCENPPQDTANGEVRQFYRQVQSSLHCRESLSESLNPLPLPDQVLRLIFFDQVKTQFIRTYRAELSNAQEILDRLGIVEPRLENLESMSRAQLIRNIHALRNRLVEILNTTSGSQPMHVSKIYAFVDRLDLTLNRLDPHCVPFDWIEGRTAQSNCIPHLEMNL